MTLKLNNLSDWSLWTKEPGQGLVLPGAPDSHKVRLDVNCAQPTAFAAWDGDQEHLPMFLGVVHGLETFEFYCAGDVIINATTDDDVYYYSASREEVWVEYPDAVNFTRVMVRRQRNHDLERLQWQMEQNQRQFFRELSLQQAAFISRFPQAAQDGDTGEVIDDDDVGDEPVVGDQGAAAAAAASAAAKKAKGPDAGGAVQPSAAGEGD